MWNIPWFPDQASSISGRVDALYIALTVLALLFSVPVAVLIVVFAVKYRRGSSANRAHAPDGNLKLELLWIAVPLVLAAGVFVWGAILFFDLATPPADAMQIYVVG